MGKKKHYSITMAKNKSKNKRSDRDKNTAYLVPKDLLEKSTINPEIRATYRKTLVPTAFFLTSFVMHMIIQENIDNKNPYKSIMTNSLTTITCTSVLVTFYLYFRWILLFSDNKAVNIIPASPGDIKEIRDMNAFQKSQRRKERQRQRNQIKAASLKNTTPQDAHTDNTKQSNDVNTAKAKHHEEACLSTQDVFTPLPSQQHQPVVDTSSSKTEKKPHKKNKKNTTHKLSAKEREEKRIKDKILNRGQLKKAKEQQKKLQKLLNIQAHRKRIKTEITAHEFIRILKSNVTTKINTLFVQNIINGIILRRVETQTQLLPSIESHFENTDQAKRQQSIETFDHELQSKQLKRHVEYIKHTKTQQTSAQKIQARIRGHIARQNYQQQITATLTLQRFTQTCLKKIMERNQRSARLIQTHARLFLSKLRALKEEMQDINITQDEFCGSGLWDTMNSFQPTSILLKCILKTIIKSCHNTKHTCFLHGRISIYPNEYYNGIDIILLPNTSIKSQSTMQLTLDLKQIILNTHQVCEQNLQILWQFSQLNYTAPLDTPVYVSVRNHFAHDELQHRVINTTRGLRPLNLDNKGNISLGALYTLKNENLTHLSNRTLCTKGQFCLDKFADNLFAIKELSRSFSYESSFAYETMNNIAALLISIPPTSVHTVANTAITKWKGHTLCCTQFLSMSDHVVIRGFAEIVNLLYRASYKQDYADEQHLQQEATLSQPS
jgi:hypothetical protein